MSALDDLEPWMQRKAEQAYDRRERKQMSREDFYSGYVDALRDVMSTSSFKPGRFYVDQEQPQ